MVMKLTINLAVGISSFILVALIIARTIYSLITGYVLPDESFYYGLFILQGLGFSVYRPILHLFYIIFFSGTDSILELFIRGAVFCTVWALGSIFMLSKILKALEIAEKPAALVILSFVFMPVFPLMAVFFVTETMALFFGLAGIYFSIRYLKGGRWRATALAAGMFLLASQVREPYIAFIVFTPLILFLLRWSARAFIAYGAVAVIVFPIPTSVVPLSLSQPVSNFLFEFLPNYLLAVIRSIHLSIPSFSWSPSGPHVTPGSFSWVPGVVSGVGPGSSSLNIPSYTYVAGKTLANGISLGPDLYAFVVGIAYGIGPIFGVLIFVSLFYAWRSKGYAVLLFSILGIVSYFFTAELTVQFTANAATVWTSNIIRLSSVALPAAMGLGYLFSRVRPRIAFAAIGITLLLGLALIGNFSSAIQSGQNVQGGGTNRLTLSYQAPYLRMHDIAQPGSLIISGGTGVMQLKVFESFSKNVTIIPIPANLGNLTLLFSRGWTHIYLYDQWVNLNAAFIKACQCYPRYYSNLVLNGTSIHILAGPPPPYPQLYGYNLMPIWSDGESYAFDVITYGYQP